MNPLDDQPIDHDGEPPPPPPKPRSKIVLRVARSAGLIALFFVAAMLGTVGGVLFAFSDDIPEISALDNYQPNTITRLLARDGQRDRRVRDRAPHRHRLRRHGARAASGHHRQRRRRLRAALRPERLAHHHHRRQGHRCPASASAPAPSRSSSRAMLFLDEYMINGVFVRSGWPLVERKLKEMLVSRAARTALHQGRDPHALREPDQSRTRRVRRRGGLADVLRQVREGADARGGRDHRGDHPDAGPAQSVRQPGAHARAAEQLRAAADGR